MDADTYALIEQAEIEAIELESKRSIDLVPFVTPKKIDHRYFERP